MIKSSGATRIPRRRLELRFCIGDFEGAIELRPRRFVSHPDRTERCSIKSPNSSDAPCGLACYAFACTRQVFGGLKWRAF
jgi:hypothetical protein